jgi:hypothetical protein
MPNNPALLTARLTTNSGTGPIERATERNVSSSKSCLNSSPSCNRFLKVFAFPLSSYQVSMVTSRNLISKYAYISPGQMYLSLPRACISSATAAHNESHARTASDSHVAHLCRNVIKSLPGTVRRATSLVISQTQNHTYIAVLFVS